MKNYYDKAGKEKILLALVPFWSPLIPPMGIAALKSFLQSKEYTVKTLDLNTEELFKQYYNRYFDLLQEVIPPDKLGNLHNIGHDVLQNHMMAHINHTDENVYIRAIKELVSHYYFIAIDDSRVKEFNRLFHEYYGALEKYFIELLDKEQPDVVGLTVYCGNLPSSMFVFKLIKERNPRIRTVMGGGIFSQQLVIGSPNFDNFLEETPYIDKIIIGEGQNLFLKYLEGKLPGSKKVVTLKDIDYEYMDQTIARVPDLSDYDIKKYTYIGASGSRSCLNQCSFCNSRVFWGEYVKRDPAIIVEEMMKINKKYGFQLFYMSDSMLNPTITPICEELVKVDAPVYIDAYLRVYEKDCDLVSDINNTLAWRRAGFYRARMGCESGSQRLLDLIGKDITIEQIKAALSSLAYAGIKTTTYWLVGLPGETEEDFQQTLALVEEMKNNIYQAECAAFIYYYHGQNKSDEWADKRMPLFSPEALKMFKTQIWTLKGDPTREVSYDRLNRFIKHIEKLGLPNPFSLHDIHKSDQRWKKLHKNAVPTLLDIDTKQVDPGERKSIKKIAPTQRKTTFKDGEFNFIPGI